MPRCRVASGCRPPRCVAPGLFGHLREAQDEAVRVRPRPPRQSPCHPRARGCAARARAARGRRADGAPRGRASRGSGRRPRLHSHHQNTGEVARVARHQRSQSSAALVSCAAERSEPVSPSVARAVAGRARERSRRPSATRWLRGGRLDPASHRRRAVVASSAVTGGLRSTQARATSSRRLAPAHPAGSRRVPRPPPADPRRCPAAPRGSRGRPHDQPVPRRAIRARAQPSRPPALGCAA